MSKMKAKVRRSPIKPAGDAPAQFWASPAPWTGADPQSLLSDDGEREPSVRALVLALAVVYNDLKGVSYAGSALGHMKTGDALTPRYAEKGGMIIQVVRWQAGLLHELMKLIQENKAVVLSNEFARLIKPHPRKVRTDWSDLAAIALAEGAMKEDKSSKSWILQRLRNQVAFHYSAHAIANGYRRHFFGEKASHLNRRAVFSDGKSMEQTRFYFADAAAQGALLEVSPGMTLELLQGLIDEVAKRTNIALRHIIVEHLARSGGELAPFNVSET